MIVQEVRSLVCGSSQDAEYVRGHVSKSPVDSGLNFDPFNHRECVWINRFLLGFTMIKYKAFPHVFEFPHCNVLGTVLGN